jgi:hypothetical protein
MIEGNEKATNGEALVATGFLFGRKGYTPAPPDE